MIIGVEGVNVIRHMCFDKSEGIGREMKMFLKTGTQFIDGNNAVEVTLDQALKHIIDHPSDTECEDNFIGFENERGEIIQFIKFSDGSWLLDVPVIINGVYRYSEQDNTLNWRKVTEIVKRFARDEYWRNICNLSKQA